MDSDIVDALMTIITAAVAFSIGFLVGWKHDSRGHRHG